MTFTSAGTPVRGLFAQRLYPGTEAIADRRYGGLAQELIDETSGAGIRQLSGFRRGTDVWFYGEYDADPQQAIARRDDMPAHRRWQHDLRDVVVGDPADPTSTIWYEEVFHTDDGVLPDGLMRRGLLSLVIDGERSAEYDARHADPWPDLIEALADSGFRNYSGFRRGAHVVYYGEFYPDMRNAFARMATHEVDACWGRAFEGIITTIRGPDGWLLTADEICHLEPRTAVP